MVRPFSFFTYGVRLFTRTSLDIDSEVGITGGQDMATIVNALILPSTAAVLKNLDTTRHSLIHYVIKTAEEWLNNKLSEKTLAYCLGIGITLFPLLLTASIDFPLLSLVSPEGIVKLPILKDWNILLMFSVTLPLSLAYIVSDEQTLIDVLSRVLQNGILTLTIEDAHSMVNDWTDKFSVLNKSTQIVGFFVGICIAYFNYKAYSHTSVGFWTMKLNGFSITGWVYIYAVFVFYWVMFVFVSRSLGIAFFLRTLASRSEIRIIPFHPDHCGGLQPIGTLGLRNLYILSVVGLNLFALFYLYPRVLILPETTYILMAAASIAYVCFGPIIFIGPLLPFRRLM